MLEHHAISESGPPYFIAEIGLNHNGDLELAKRQARAAEEAGALAAKFQLFSVESFIHPEARLGDGPAGSLADFFRQFELSSEEWGELAAYVRSLGLDFLCSVFDRPSLELYLSLHPRALKISSCDLTNAFLLHDIEELCPELALLVSTGTCDEAEISDFVKQAGPRPFALLECVSAYPADPADYDLRLLRHWKEAYGCLVGLSDHTEGIGLSIASVGFGATLIERHFTIDKGLPGPDQSLSLEPSEFQKMCREALSVSASIRQSHDAVKVCHKSEEGARLYGRRSLYAARDLPRASNLKREDWIAQRPGSEGISPRKFEDLAEAERSLANPLPKGAALKKEELL